MPTPDITDADARERQARRDLWVLEARAEHLRIRSAVVTTLMGICSFLLIALAFVLTMR